MGPYFFSNYGHFLIEELWLSSVKKFFLSLDKTIAFFSFPLPPVQSIICPDELLSCIHSFLYLNCSARSHLPAFLTRQADEAPLLALYFHLLCLPNHPSPAVCFSAVNLKHHCQILDTFFIQQMNERGWSSP